MSRPTFKKAGLFLEAEYKCSYCRCDFVFSEHDSNFDSRHPTRDHIVPISVIKKLNLNKREQNIYKENTVICCYKCNNERGSIPILKFLQQKNFEIAPHVNTKIKKMHKKSIHDIVSNYYLV